MQKLKRGKRAIGTACAWVAVALLAAGCNPGGGKGDGGAAGGGAKAAGRKASVQQAPWMAGERWGMPPSEVAGLAGTAPALQSESSDYYAGEVEGRTVLSQYVFGKAGPEDGGERKLVRKIVYLANPKRAAYLPLLGRDEALVAFGELREELDAEYGASELTEREMAVSAKLESQARVIGDRVQAAEKEVRGMERELEARRKELQRQYAGQKNRNALVAEGLLELEKPLKKAQWKLTGLMGEQVQVRRAIREENAALPENERPFQKQAEWEAADGRAALYLTVNARGTYLSLSFWAPE